MILHNDNSGHLRAFSIRLQTHLATCMHAHAGTIAEQDRNDESDTAGVGSAALDKDGLLSQLQQEMQPSMTKMGRIPLELSLATQYTPSLRRCNMV